MSAPSRFLAVCTAAVLAGSLPVAVQAADANAPAGQLKVCRATIYQLIHTFP